MRPARQAAGHLALLRMMPYLRARRSELSYQAWFRLLAVWRALCGTLPLYDYLVRPTGLLFAVVGGLLLRSVRSLDRFLDDRAALLRSRSRSVTRPVAALAFLTAVVLILSLTLFGTGLEVFIDGESIGFVGSEAEFTAALREVETRVSEILGRPFSVAPDVRYRFGTVNRHQIFNHDEVVERLFGQIDDVRRLFTLSIDGVLIAAVENSNEIGDVLDRVLDAFTPQVHGFVGSGFAENITTDHRWVDASILMTEARLEALLFGSHRTAQTTAMPMMAEGFAVAAPMAVSAHAAPLARNTIATHLGTLLTVEATATRAYTEEIPFDVRFEPDDTMYRNQTRLISTGVPGTRRIVEEVQFRNGVEVGSAIISETVVVEPLDEWHALGQLTVPSTNPFGIFIRPLAMSSNVSLISRFGWRNNPTNPGTRENHLGVDWSAPRGTPILAADGGRVRVVGNLGNQSFGRYVIIDHGIIGGRHIETLYAHCNSIIVREGDRVRRGETIAYVGSTGRSTGNHLHFEVRINGVSVNPFSNSHSNVPM
jgi:hypothetical protein